MKREQLAFKWSDKDIRKLDKNIRKVKLPLLQRTQCPGNYFIILNPLKDVK